MPFAPNIVSFFPKKKTKKENTLLLQSLVAEIEGSFQCGEVLIPNEGKYAPLKDLQVCVNRAKTCTEPIETQFYTGRLKSELVWFAIGVTGL